MILFSAAVCIGAAEYIEDMPPNKRKGSSSQDQARDPRNKRQAVEGQTPISNSRAPLSTPSGTQQAQAARFPGTGMKTPVPLPRSTYTLPSSQTSPPSSGPQFPTTQAFDAEALENSLEGEEMPCEFYAVLNTKIVGIRYYSGFAQAGESVLCRREPSNPYDQNAIRVDNVLYHQIGHIPRNVASKLAKYMDAGDLVIEAKLTGEKGTFDMPIRLYLHGPIDPAERRQVETKLKADKLVKATELNQTRKQAELHRKLDQERNKLGLGSLEQETSSRSEMGLKSQGTTVGIQRPNDEPQVSLEELHKLSQAVNFRHGSGDIVQGAMDEDALSKLPMAEQPASLKAQMLPYQLQGLAWLTKKENPKFPQPGSKEATQLWQRNKQGKYLNIASQIMCKDPPKLLSGGILADDMGLGKTLQIISLVLTGGTGTTLIVAPVSVMSNWKQQMERHVLPDHLPKILIYHTGSKPDKGQSFKKYFSGYDVVITSYGKVASEYNTSYKPLGLYDMDWRRIVLDEGHVIRNSKAKVSQSACNLKAQSRWVLSGTPVVNGIKDLHSILKFLHITGGIEDPLVFSSLVSRPLASNDPTALGLLHSIMRDLCLRRKKDMKFIDLKLPSKTEYVHRITFRPEEKTKYEALLAEAKGALEEHLARARATHRGKKGNNEGKFQGVLERLLRLRQTCNHWTLCKSRHVELLKLLEGEEVVELNPKNKAILQQALTLWLESQEDCPICMEPKTDVLITHCKHIFCRPCIMRVLQTQTKCPMCRNQLKENNLLEPAPETTGDEDFDGEAKSSKTEGLIQILRATLKKEGSKVVVFSQWTSFLNVIEKNLEEASINFVRVDGSMKPADRDVAIGALETDPDARVMLASLGVCSVGLNLVAADTVVLADSWWAPAIEDQAVDRVHRLGQKRETTVWRLVMEDSVEERVLEIQSEKRDLVSKAFQDKDGEKKKVKETRMADVMKLLG
ncbi:hypothetical protein MKZ38_002031 [Zalerion maritima]|uniref:Uncharacterized protein n=1 Tax=Zalerion maritima TaxID=339359 RepID=A0AAD5RYI2_9PEZI|nr:hypothetical protein MKZ38_002031 [Zalerion maritima]